MGGGGGNSSSITCFKEKIERFVAHNNTFSFMNSVKVTLAYSKQFLYDVLAMV